MDKIDITQMSVEALKALAYDEMAKLQFAQQNLQLINQEISKKQNEFKEPPKSEEVVEAEVVEEVENK
jgi:hypothetical protein